MVSSVRSCLSRSVSNFTLDLYLLSYGPICVPIFLCFSMSLFALNNQIQTGSKDIFDSKRNVEESGRLKTE